MTMNDTDRTCVICEGRFTGHGHNAEPVRVGRCCDECNIHVVLPERIDLKMGALVGAHAMEIFHD